jgi:5S rRNA maturation endonuclease (ribonuclease M5)
VRIDSDHAALKGLEADTEVVWLTDQDEGGQKLGLTILSMN